MVTLQEALVSIRLGVGRLVLQFNGGTFRKKGLRSICILIGNFRDNLNDVKHTQKPKPR